MLLIILIFHIQYVHAQVVPTADSAMNLDETRSTHFCYHKHGNNLIRRINSKSMQNRCTNILKHFVLRTFAFVIFLLYPVFLLLI